MMVRTNETGREEQKSLAHCIQKMTPEQHAECAELAKKIVEEAHREYKKYQDAEEVRRMAEDCSPSA